MQCNHLAPHAQGACCGQSNDVSNTCGSTKHGWDDCFRDSNSNALQTQGGEPQVTDNKQEGSSHSFGETADTQACADGQASQRCQHGPIDKLYQNSTWTVLPRDPTGAVMPVDSAGLSISTSSSSADDTTADADSAAPSNSVFFARVPPTVPYEAIHALFAQFGTVLNLNLFRPWASAKTSKVGLLLFNKPRPDHTAACGCPRPASLVGSIMPRTPQCRIAGRSSKGIQKLQPSFTYLPPLC